MFLFSQLFFLTTLLINVSFVSYDLRLTSLRLWLMTRSIQYGMAINIYAWLSSVLWTQNLLLQIGIRFDLFPQCLSTSSASNAVQSVSLRRNKCAAATAVNCTCCRLIGDVICPCVCVCACVCVRTLCMYVYMCVCKSLLVILINISYLYWLF